MDFTIGNPIDFSSNGESYGEGKKDSLSKNEGFKEVNDAIVACTLLADQHLDLVANCLHTKSDKFLSDKELEKYGLLALYTAALEVKENQDFRPFAAKRIEFMMNRAIAEAYLIQEITKNKKDNNSLGKAFDSIHQIYNY